MADGYDSIKNHRIIIPQQSFSIEFTFSFCYPQIPAARTPHNTQGCLLLWLWYRIHQKFDALLITFKYHWNEYYSHCTMKGKVRQRISYNRKNSVLPLIQDKTLFILVYLRTNPLQKLHATQFEMTQFQANRWIHLRSEIFRHILKTLFRCRKCGFEDMVILSCLWFTQLQNQS